MLVLVVHSIDKSVNENDIEGKNVSEKLKLLLKQEKVRQQQMGELQWKIRQLNLGSGNIKHTPTSGHIYK